MNKGPHARTAPGWSIFGRQHNREDAQRFVGIARVFAAHVMPGADAGPVVVVDLPKDASAVVLEAAEVVFAVWVVVRREAVERRNLFGNFYRCRQAEVTNAGGH